jgi:preprotein translocase subunit SecY
VLYPGIGFLLTTTMILTVGGIFIMWLGEQITDRGIGNGMSLLIFFSIIEGFPTAIVRTWEATMTGVLSPTMLVILVVTMVAITAGVVAMTMAARKLPVQIPRKVMGRGRVREGQKSFIPLRINSAGVMPIIFAQSIIIVPGHHRGVQHHRVPPAPVGHVPAR